MPDKLTSIFISYAHADSPFVDRLEADLCQHGFAPWVDRHGLAGGQKWRRELEAAVDRSQVLLVVLSPEAMASEYVQQEYGYASDEGKVVIPLYYRPCKVPMELRGFQWIEIHPLLWIPETFGLIHQLFISSRAEVAQRRGTRKLGSNQSNITEELYWLLGTSV